MATLQLIAGEKQVLPSHGQGIAVGIVGPIALSVKTLTIKA
jgi:hypothetical protein